MCQHLFYKGNKVNKNEFVEHRIMSSALNETRQSEQSLEQ